MITETLILETRDGRKSEGTAVVTRRSEGARIGKAVGILIAGFTLAAISIVIPIVHLIAPWALPLLAIGIAYFSYTIQTSVGEISAQCLDCDANMTLEGGALTEALWSRCPNCKLPYLIVPPGPAPSSD